MDRALAPPPPQQHTGFVNSKDIIITNQYLRAAKIRGKRSMGVENKVTLTGVAS